MNNSSFITDISLYDASHTKLHNLEGENMSEFYVGQEVVCINDRGFPGCRSCGAAVKWPTANIHYTIREIYDNDSLRLVEIINPVSSHKEGQTEHAFFMRRFRPIKSESIKFFRQMCVSKKPLVKV